MNHLDQKFLSSYVTETPPWGFGGMGEVVYLRTYSREIDGAGRSETWIETCARAVNGAIDIGAPLETDEAERLFDHMFNLRCSLSGHRSSKNLMPHR
jgi:hypothetical protein